jgi:hypothetical protein
MTTASRWLQNGGYKSLWVYTEHQIITYVLNFLAEILLILPYGLGLTDQCTTDQEVRIGECKYNLIQDLFKKSKIAQHAHEEDHKICWKEAKVLQIQSNSTYWKHKEAAHMVNRA